MTMKRDYFRFINPFGNKKRRRFRRMQRQAMRNYFALKANADNARIKAILDRTEPIYKAYEQEYVVWDASHGPSKGGTKSFKDVILMLTSKLDDWDYGIRGVFSRDSVEFMTLFPNKRYDFYSSSQLAKLTRIGALKSALATFPQLNAVYLDVSAYYSLLSSTLETKDIKHDDIQTSSSALKSAHDDMADTLWENMNELLIIYKKTPLLVAHYFDMALLRSSQGDKDENIKIITLKVNSKTAYAINYTEGLKLLLTNLGRTVLYYYFAATERAPVPDALLQIKADEETELQEDVLKEAENKYVIFVNSDTKKKGKIEIIREL